MQGQYSSQWLVLRMYIPCDPVYLYLSHLSSFNKYDQSTLREENGLLSRGPLVSDAGTTTTIDILSHIMYVSTLYLYVCIHIL